MKTIEELNFSNSFARLPQDFYVPTDIMPLLDAHMVHFNCDAARSIGLHEDEQLRPEFLQYLNGEIPLPGSEPLASIYAGHQFGQYVEQLGDGRAILLGEVMDEQGQRTELQLKGAGLTAFSRQGDGRAVLRSTIREYLASEAMHALGIPTTRALCIIGSREEVYREQIENGALLLRMAPSHLRFGSFELFFYRQQYEQLRVLADYAIDHHFPHLREQADPYFGLFNEALESTAQLIAQWQCVGFAHGVMNTDNMSLLGLTIDYGPFGFLDRYDPGHICNHSDYSGRYSFENQPVIARWNISRLGQALLPLFQGTLEESAEKANAQLAVFKERYEHHYHEGMCAKLGLASRQQGDRELIKQLLRLMKQNQMDYSHFMRRLNRFDSSAQSSFLRDDFVDREGFDNWARDYSKRLQQEGSEDRQRKERMDKTNPKYILRNYLAQRAIEKAEQNQDYSEIDILLKLLQSPYDEHPQLESYAQQPPQWAQEIVLSCSS